MQVWMVAIPPTSELTDLEAIALLSGLAAGAAALADEPLDQQRIAPTAAPAWEASKSRETYASASALSIPSRTAGIAFEALYRQQSEDKLNDAMADVLALCRERWQELKRTTRRDVVQHCDGFKDKDRRALRYLRSLEDKGLLKSKADTTENGAEITFKPTE